MVLESTMICVDNSEYMRNGDYTPNRLQAQQDAVNTVCRYKLMANPENSVGLLTLSNGTEVLATLTNDAGKILTSLHKIQPQGYINLLTGIRIAHLSLKHRGSKHHKMRIVAFVGSPTKADEKDAIRLAKRLKKENVNIDFVHFGETEGSHSMLEAMISTINGDTGSGSRLITIPPSPHLADALRSSPILQSEDGPPAGSFATGGQGFDFVDPNEDPELALALRVSMEEQRARQQEEERRATEESGGETATTEAAAATETPMETGEVTAATEAAPAEDEMLRQALAMSLEAGGAVATEEAPKSTAKDTASNFPDFSSMTEAEQLQYAMEISLQGSQSKDEPMEVDTTSDKSGKKDQTDFSEVINDEQFLTDVLKNLPGVNPDSPAVQEAVGSLTAQKDKKTKKPEEKK